MDTKKLRQKVLDLAIHGKLVKQDPNDEPASILLDRIRKEKERLVGEGKLKNHRIIYDEENEIPKGWVITNIGELLINRDSERIPLSLDVRNQQKNRIYDYYGAAGVIDKVDSYLFDERLLLIGEDGANLLSRSKDNAFFAEGKYWVNNHAHVLDCTEKAILDYVAYIINSMNLEKYITGSAQPKLSQDNLNKIPILLPPLAEQHRIVKAVNELFGQIDIIEQSEKEINEASDKVRSKVLNLAIQGRLVPQDPNDEPASVLLDKICKEKERLVKEGKLKKKDLEEKPISEDEIPFDIPEGWEWCRLKQICSKIIDGDHNPPAGLTSKTEYLMISSKNINDDKLINLDDVRFLSKEVFEKEDLRTQARKNDILFTSVGSLGRSCIIQDESLNLSFQRSVTILTTYIFNSYLKRYLDSPYVQSFVNEHSSGTAQRGFYLNQMELLIVPLPPLAEQRRIVEKIEEILSAVEKLHS